MKDAYELLQQKQADIARVRKEIDSLNLVAMLLADDGPSNSPIKKPSESSASSLNDTISRRSDSAATNVDGMFASLDTGSGFWDSLKRAR